MTQISRPAAGALAHASPREAFALSTGLAWTFQRSEGAELVRRRTGQVRKTTGNIIWLDG